MSDLILEMESPRELPDAGASQGDTLGGCIDQTNTQPAENTQAPNPGSPMRRYSIMAAERLSDGHDVEVCQVDTNPGPIAAGLRKKRTATDLRKYRRVRIVDHLKHERIAAHG